MRQSVRSVWFAVWLQEADEVLCPIEETDATTASVMEAGIRKSRPTGAVKQTALHVATVRARLDAVVYDHGRRLVGAASDICRGLTMDEICNGGPHSPSLASTWSQLLTSWQAYKHAMAPCKKSKELLACMHSCTHACMHPHTHMHHILLYNIGVQDCRSTHELGSPSDDIAMLALP